MWIGAQADVWKEVPLDIGDVYFLPRGQYRFRNSRIYFKTYRSFERMAYALLRVSYFIEDQNHHGRIVDNETVVHDINTRNFGGGYDLLIEDITLFFTEVERLNLEHLLFDEEKELKKLLIDGGLLRNSNGIYVGAEKTAFLAWHIYPRNTMERSFIMHEIRHGLWFTTGYRDWIAAYFNSLSEPEKIIIRTIIGANLYNVDDQPLLEREFASYFSDYDALLRRLMRYINVDSIIRALFKIDETSLTIKDNVALGLKKYEAILLEGEKSFFEMFDGQAGKADVFGLMLIVVVGIFGLLSHVYGLTAFGIYLSVLVIVGMTINADDALAQAREEIQAMQERHITDYDESDLAALNRIASQLIFSLKENEAFKDAFDGVELSIYEGQQIFLSLPPEILSKVSSAMKSLGGDLGEAYIDILVTAYKVINNIAHDQQTKYLRMIRYRQGLELLNAALAYDADGGYLLSERFITFVHLHEWENAECAWEELEESSEDHRSANVRRGYMKIMQGNLAKENFDHAVKASRFEETQSSLSEAALHYREAEKVLLTETRPFITGQSKSTRQMAGALAGLALLYAERAQLYLSARKAVNRGFIHLPYRKDQIFSDIKKAMEFLKKAIDVDGDNKHTNQIFSYVYDISTQINQACFPSRQMREAANQWDQHVRTISASGGKKSGETDTRMAEISSMLKEQIDMFNTLGDAALAETTELLTKKEYRDEESFKNDLRAHLIHVAQEHHFIDPLEMIDEIIKENHRDMVDFAVIRIFLELETTEMTIDDLLEFVDPRIIDDDVSIDPASKEKIKNIIQKRFRMRFYRGFGFSLKEENGYGNGNGRHEHSTNNGSENGTPAPLPDTGGYTRDLMKDYMDNDPKHILRLRRNLELIEPWINAPAVASFKQEINELEARMGQFKKEGMILLGERKRDTAKMIAGELANLRSMRIGLKSDQGYIATLWNLDNAIKNEIKMVLNRIAFSQHLVEQYVRAVKNLELMYHFHSLEAIGKQLEGIAQDLSDLKNHDSDSYLSKEAHEQMISEAEHVYHGVSFLEEHHHDLSKIVKLVNAAQNQAEKISDDFVNGLREDTLKKIYAVKEAFENMVFSVYSNNAVESIQKQLDEMVQPIEWMVELSAKITDVTTYLDAVISVFHANRGIYTNPPPSYADMVRETEETNIALDLALEKLHGFKFSHDEFLDNEMALTQTVDEISEKWKTFSDQILKVIKVKIKHILVELSRIRRFSEKIFQWLRDDVLPQYKGLHKEKEILGTRLKKAEAFWNELEETLRRFDRLDGDPLVKLLQKLVGIYNNVNTNIYIGLDKLTMAMIGHIKDSTSKLGNLAVSHKKELTNKIRSVEIKFWFDEFRIPEKLSLKFNGHWGAEQELLKEATEYPTVVEKLRELEQAFNCYKQYKEYGKLPPLEIFRSLDFVITYYLCAIENNYDQPIVDALEMLRLVFTWMYSEISIEYCRDLPDRTEERASHTINDVWDVPLKIFLNANPTYETKTWSPALIRQILIFLMMSKDFNVIGASEENTLKIIEENKIDTDRLAHYLSLWQDGNQSPITEAIRAKLALTSPDPERRYPAYRYALTDEQTQMFERYQRKEGESLKLNHSHHEAALRLIESSEMTMIDGVLMNIGILAESKHMVLLPMSERGPPNATIVQDDIIIFVHPEDSPKLDPYTLARIVVHEIFEQYFLQTHDNYQSHALAVLAEHNFMLKGEWNKRLIWTGWEMLGSMGGRFQLEDPIDSKRLIRFSWSESMVWRGFIITSMLVKRFSRLVKRFSTLVKRISTFSNLESSASTLVVNTDNPSPKILKSLRNSSMSVPTWVAVKALFDFFMKLLLNNGLVGNREGKTEAILVKERNFVNQNVMAGFYDRSRSPASGLLENRNGELMRALQEAFGGFGFTSDQTGRLVKRIILIDAEVKNFENEKDERVGALLRAMVIQSVYLNNYYWELNHALTELQQEFQLNFRFLEWQKHAVRHLLLEWGIYNPLGLARMGDRIIRVAGGETN